jgi:exodeoxyribonuclease VII small subunit
MVAMKEINFEQALKELEAIVMQLETGNVALEESIKLYQRGLELYGMCYEKLQEAEKLVVKINDNQTKE